MSFVALPPLSLLKEDPRILQGVVSERDWANGERSRAPDEESRERGGAGRLDARSHHVRREPGWRGQRGGKVVTGADEGEEPTKVDVAARDYGVTTTSPTPTATRITRRVPEATGTAASKLALETRNKPQGGRRPPAVAVAAATGRGRMGSSTTQVMVEFAGKVRHLLYSKLILDALPADVLVNTLAVAAPVDASSGAGAEGEVLGMERHPQLHRRRSLPAPVTSSNGRHVPPTATMALTTTTTTTRTMIMETMNRRIGSRRRLCLRRVQHRIPLWR